MTEDNNSNGADNIESTKVSSRINIINNRGHNTLATKLSTSHVGVWNTLKNWLKLTEKDLEAVDVFLAASLDRRIAGDPMWLFLVAPSGGPKSELIRSLYGLDGMYTLSSLTSKTLISGKMYKDEETGETHYLGKLKEIDGKVLLIKDFTVILSKPPIERDEIFSQFRDIYDGYMEKAFGNFDDVIRVKCFMGFIAGVTPAIDHYQKLQTLLGERFLKVRMATIKRTGAEKASRNSGYETEMRNEIANAVQGFLSSLKPKKIELTDEQRDIIIDCACYIAKMRTWVYVRFGYHGDIIEIEPSESESPTRVAKQLTKLVNLLAVVRGHDKIEDEDMSSIKRVARDTAIPKRQKVVDALIKEKLSATLTSIANKSGLHPKTVKHEVERMISLGILDGSADEDTNQITFDKDFKKLVESVAPTIKDDEEPKVDEKKKDDEKTSVNSPTPQEPQIDQSIFDKIKKEREEKAKKG